MITVQQAAEIIRKVPFNALIVNANIGMATGHVLAELIIADRDLPPFHRATMDGIAISFDEYLSGVREFIIEGIQQAGHPQQTLRSTKSCLEIMTGAILPAGSDTVVRYEDITIKDNKAIVNVAIERNQSVHFRGIDTIANQNLLYPGIRLTAAEIAIIASVGKHEVDVFSVKPFSVVSTGDELVPIETEPQPWQIRQSNGVALASALSAMNIDANISHLPDDPKILEEELKSIIERHEVIILSGGVSKGKFDYVPAILEKLGIKKMFHHVQQRPGKPFWFGTGGSKTVFALPGNPVSTFLCFHRYIKPWIEAGLGIKPKSTKAILAEDYTFKPDLTYFLQVKIDTSDGRLWAKPVTGEGSGDFVNLRNVDGFIELPSDRTEFKKGELFPYISFR